MPCNLNTKCSYGHRETDSGSSKIAKSKRACIVEAHESARKRLEGTIKRSRRSHRGERVQIDKSLQSWTQVCSHAASDEKIQMHKSRSGQRMGEGRKVAGLASDQSTEQNRGHLGSTKRAKDSSLGYTVGHLSSKNSDLEPKFRTSSQRCISLHPSENGRCSITIKAFKVRVP